ncbi:MAG TPA: TIGR03435 family protein [Bryobacteraceae bacterium]|nr:TIGR03435 family protein [Bryobacteraceae bacterium]
MMRLFVTVLLAASAFGQKFDVASIKPSDPSSHGMSIGISPSGSFRATGVTLFSLIQQAYDVRGFQVSGGPGWMTTDRYDILTKNEAAGPTESDLMKMNDAAR